MTLSLPLALSPWAAELSIFPRDVALSLGPMVSRLASLVGPLHRHRHGGAGEVDGYDGLSRHGSYERLLVTEWLLADEAPEEFLRRAAGGEHTFLRLARPEPDAARLCHALFDAGPAQLGTPRVVHIAALVVLARRAAIAGVPFRWGILQRPGTPGSELTAATVLRLLEARTPFEATAADLKAWSRTIGTPKGTDDLWLVGGERVDRLPGAQAASRLIVADVLEPGVRRVLAEVRHGARERASVTLNLPAPDDTTRLLRDPFATTAPAPLEEPGPRPASNLVFSDNGIRLFARLVGGGAIDQPIGNSPRAQVGAPRIVRVHATRPLVAIGRVRGKTVSITRQDAGYWLHAPKKGVTEYRVDAAAHAPRSVGPLGACHALGNDDIVFRHDTCLLRFEHLLQAAVVAYSVLDSAADGDGGVLYLDRAANGVVRLARLFGKQSSGKDLGTGERGWLGYGETGAAALAALAESSSVVRVWHPGGTTVVRLPSDVTVVGVCRNIRRRNEPGALVLEGDGRTLMHVGQSWTRRLARAAAPIDRIVVSAGKPYVAWTTTAGELVVYSIDHEAALLRR